MWRDGNGALVPDAVEWIKTNLATGEFEHISIGCDADERRGRRKAFYASTVVLDYSDKRGSIWIGRGEMCLLKGLNVSEKLIKEGEKIVKFIEDSNIVSLANQYHVTYNAHIDINENPRWESNKVLSTIKGWIEGYGIPVVSKPDSYASNSVADKVARLKSNKKKELALNYD